MNNFVKLVAGSLVVVGALAVMPISFNSFHFTSVGRANPVANEVKSPNLTYNLTRNWVAVREFPGLSNSKKLNTDANGLRYYTANSQMQGIPYSSSTYVDGDVLVSRNLNSFYSAALNPASVLYTKRLTDGKHNSRASYYGVVCSSVVSYVTNQTMPLSTTEIEKKMSFYGGNDASKYSVGDVMYTKGHVRILTNVVRDKKGAVTKIDVLEAWKPFVRCVSYDVPSFQKLMVENGGAYRIGVLENATMRTPEKIVYSTKVISEYGDRTWYEVGSDIWVYLPDNPEVLYVAKGGNINYNPKTVKVSEMGSKVVNNVKVYNLKSALNSAGIWAIQTEAKEKIPAKLELVDLGNVVLGENNELSIAGYSVNAKPVWYMQLELLKNAEVKYHYPTPDSYTAYPSSKGVLSEQDSNIKLKKTVNDMYVRVYYQTRYGQAHKDSNAIIGGKISQLPFRYNSYDK